MNDQCTPVFYNPQMMETTRFAGLCSLWYRCEGQVAGFPNVSNKSEEISPHEELTFGKVAIRRGLVSAEQVEECLQVQEETRSLGKNPQPLGEIMVSKGLISTKQADEILSIQQSLDQKRVIAGYEVITRIGKGATGIVYKARQISLDRPVAIKILAPRYAKDQKYLKQFVQEARTVAKLNHENIIGGIDVGQSHGYYYFAMEFVDGDSGAQWVYANGALPEKRVLEIGRDIARALEHASKHGMVHRDVKPQNVLLTRDGIAKLCDLGLAKISGGRRTEKEGFSVGTPHYISPEQARGQSDVDTRSDIYSLGATLFFLATGQTPFSDVSPMVLMTKHLTTNPGRASERNPKVSDELSSIISKMMEKDVADRYQTAKELHEDIERLLSGEAPLIYKPGSKRLVQSSGSRRLNKTSATGSGRLPKAAASSGDSHKKARSSKPKKSPSKRTKPSQGKGGRKKPIRRKSNNSNTIVFVGVILVLLTAIGFYVHKNNQPKQPGKEITREQDKESQDKFNECLDYSDLPGTRVRLKALLKELDPRTLGAREAEKFLKDNPE